MADKPSIDEILSPWVYESGAPPAETRLLSATDAGSGSLRLSPDVLRMCADRLVVLRGEADRDVNTALRETDGAPTGPGLQISKAIDHVHDRWVDKLKHLLGDMDERASRLRKAADKWNETEEANAKAFKAGH